LSAERHILIIAVDPPQAGDPIYVCRDNGDGLVDGDVYVRARGETRRAKSGEIDQLRAREAAAAPNVALDIEILGPVRAYTCSSSVLDQYVEERERWLLGHLPKPPPAFDLSGGASLAAVMARMSETATASSALGGFLNALSEPENRTEDEYRDEVSKWAGACRSGVVALIDGLVARSGMSTQFVVRNQTAQFLSGVEIDLHLSGEVEQIPARARSKVRPAGLLPKEPREWGPRPIDYGIGRSIAFPMESMPASPASGPRATFSNGGSVRATFELPELRPFGVATLDDDVVLIIRDPAMTTVEGAWSATARDVNARFEGQFVLPVQEPRDVTKYVRDFLAEED